MNLFCNTCNSYLGPQAVRCEHCKEELIHDPMLPPDVNIWSTTLPGSLVGPPLVTSNQVICCWCDEDKSGIQGLDSQSGKPLWYKPITEAPQNLILNQDRIFVAAQGITRSLGGVYAYQLHGRDEPTLLWVEPSQEKASGCCAILLNGDRLYAINRGGNLFWLNAEQKGRLITEIQIPCDEGHKSPENKRLGRWGQQVVVVCQCGAISLVPPGLSGQIQVIDTKRALTGSFIIYKDILYAGTKQNGGGLLRIDLRQKSIQTLPDGNDLQRVNALPGHHNNLLLVSAFSHHLHALEVESGREVWRSQPECPHSLNSRPIVVHGLAYVGANDGRLHVFDVADGRESARWALPPGFTHVDNPAADDERIFVSAHKKENGKTTSCLMVAHWSHQQFEKAARQLEIERSWEEAAGYYVLASQEQDCIIDQQRCQQLQQKAVECWIRAGKPELAGAFWDALGDDERAIPCLVNAAQLARDRHQPKIAAEYYDHAALLCWQLGRFDERDKYQKQAARLACWPVLRLTSFNVPKLTLKTEGRITIRVENIGNQTARKLVCAIGGSLAATFVVHLNENLTLLPGKHMTIGLHVTPTRERDTLTINLEYSPENEERSFEDRLEISLEADPEPLIIETGDTVLSDIDIVLPPGRTAIVRLGDRVMSNVRIQENATGEPTQVTSSPGG